MSISNELKEPKKRGRRPKIKTQEEINEITNKIPKKRGRRPKPKTNEPKVPKKRGRKPKLNLNINQEPIVKAKIQDNVILHLPISNSIILDENKLHYDPNINIPSPNDDTNINFTVLKDNSNNNEFDNLNNFYFDIPKQINENVQPNEKIIKNNSNKYVDIKYNLNHSCNTNYKTLNSQNNYCFWDTCIFEGQIYGLPIKRENNEIFIFGTFCSPECAAAYNFNRMNDNSIWERYSILNEIYGDSKPIKIASSTLLIDKFGGDYSIEEYRKLNVSNKLNYNLIMPPLVSYVPSLEEIVIDINYNHISLNKNKLKNISEKYKLKKIKIKNTKIF